jgi:hypothetical protein
MQKTKDAGFVSGYAGSGSQDISPIIKNYMSSTYNTAYFDSNNYDIHYHDSIDTIASNPDAYGLPNGTSWVIDHYGNKVAMLNPDIPQRFTYYDPGTYARFGPGNYVPSYTDSVFLSQSLNFLRKSPYAKT